MTVPTLPITTCPEGAGSVNTPGAGNLPPVGSYVPNPDLCIGDFRLNDPTCSPDELKFQESLVAEQLEISGATVNIFKLLGVHEQGRLIDLTGEGQPIASSGTPANAFDALAGSWVSVETGLAVTGTPSYLGYDFGIRLTSYGQAENAPGAPNLHHITSLRLTQGPDATTRVRQLRVDRSDGGYQVNQARIQFTGAGNGTFGQFQAGFESQTGLLMLAALTPTSFSVAFIGPAGAEVLGVAIVGQRFDSRRGSFIISQGSIPFAVNDSFAVPIELAWYRVDVINVPDLPVAVLEIKQSKPSRYWRIVPLVFSGVMTGSSWVVDKLELFDYQVTRLDTIQDTLFMENRDRDYANSAISLKSAYTPFDAASDMSKFGFQVPDIYTFTASFAVMVLKLGRPIVVGDVLELPNELQYDHNLRPVRRFLEVTDVSWSAESYAPGTWKPLVYKFVAQQLIPGQEHRDILGTVDTQKYAVDDGSFFAGIEQIQTAPLTVTEANQAEAQQKVPEKGTNVREQRSGTNRFKAPGTYDGVGPYVEDGLPPDGQAYTEGFKLPDVSAAMDGDFFRLNYDPKLKIPARLYKFSAVKNRWIFVETDRRTINSSHKPSEQTIFNLDDKKSLGDKL